MIIYFSTVETIQHNPLFLIILIDDIVTDISSDLHVFGDSTREIKKRSFQLLTRQESWIGL